MDRIQLPLIKGSVTLRAAFDRMAASGMHAAIVTAPGREPALVRNTDLDEAFDLGLKRIGEVRGTPLHVAQAEMEDWEAALDDAGAAYGAVLADSDDDGEIDEPGSRKRVNRGAGPAMVTIVTRHERLAAEIRGYGEVCRCTGKDAHRGQKGAGCRFCGSPVRCA